MAIFAGKRTLLFFSVTALLFVLLQFSLLRTFPVTDEAQFLLTASLVLDGKVIYRDFSDIHPPALTYVTALAFRLFGESYLVARSMMIAVSIITAFVLYLVGRRLFGEKAGRTAYLIYGIYSPVLHGFLVFTSTFIALLGALALLQLIGYFESGKESGLFLAGILLGLAILFRQTALFSFAGLLAATLLALRTVRSRGRAVVLMTSGALLPLALFLFYLHSQGALQDFADDIFGLDYARYARNTLVRYPLEPSVHLVSALSFIFMIPLAYDVLRKKARASPAMLAILLLGLFSLLNIWPNFSYPTFTIVLVPGALSAGWVFSQERWRRPAVVLAAAMLLVSAYFYSHRALKDEFLGNNEFNNYNFYEIPDYIRARTQPGDTIYGFSGTINYFLTGRNPASKHWYLRYYENKMDERQLRIIRDLESNRPKYVVYSPNEVIDTEKVADYAPRVNNYILQNYMVEKEFSDTPTGTVWLMGPKS